MQFATNFVGHFALTVGLYDALAAASVPGSSRSAQRRICRRQSSSMTCTFVAGPTAHEPLTRSRSPPRLSSPLRRPGAGRRRGSTPTRLIPVLLPRVCSSTPAAW